LPRFALLQTAESATQENAPDTVDYQIADEEACRHTDNQAQNENSTAIGFRHK
jgi:hypothetical protein